MFCTSRVRALRCIGKQLSFDTVIDLPCKLVDLFSLCAATDWMMEERDLQRLLQPVSSGSLTHPYAPSICFHAQSVSSQLVLHLVILAHRWWLEHPPAKCWLFARPLPLIHVRTTRTHKPTWANPSRPVANANQCKSWQGLPQTSQKGFKNPVKEKFHFCFCDSWRPSRNRKVSVLQTLVADICGPPKTSARLDRPGCFGRPLMADRLHFSWLVVTSLELFRCEVRFNFAW